MTRYLIAALCFVAVSARPEPPSQSYGVPGRQSGIPVAAPASLPAQTYILQPIDAPQSFEGGSVQSNGYSSQSSGYSSQSGSYSAPSSGYSAPSSGYSAPSSGYSAPSSGYSAPSGGGSFHGNQGGGSFGSGSAPAQAIVQKHIYVHVPPPEPEEQFNSGGIGGGVARKNYKIIFIKVRNKIKLLLHSLNLFLIILQAPSYGGGSQFNSPALQAQTQEKTIVYVLVKKPDALEQFDSQGLPTGPAPSKPEVYFIKYKATSHQGGGGGFQGDIRASGGGNAISAVQAPNLGGGELLAKVVSGGAGAGDQGGY